PPPNDNNRVLWTSKPIGESPDLGWTACETNGATNADLHGYDQLGREIMLYGHEFRSSAFGDGNAASGTQAQVKLYGPGMYPTEIRTPSGDHTKPWDH